MGCLGAGLVALLALAVPASIARASLVGALVVLVVLALAAGGALVTRARRRGVRPPRRAWATLAVVTALYAAVVVVAHLA